MMPETFLVFETSTETGSVALVRGSVLVAELSFSSRDRATGARTEALAPAVEQCMALAGLAARDLSAIVCGAGPGGFTSLRSAASLAKGMCSALQIPLYAASSLELLAWSATIPDGAFIAALPAGRNEWFFVDVMREAYRTTVVGEACLIADADLHTRAKTMHAELIGPGLAYDVVPRAASIVPWISAIQACGPVDLDLWEPVYGRLAEAQVKWEAAHGRSLVV